MDGLTAVQNVHENKDLNMMYASHILHSRIHKMQIYLSVLEKPSFSIRMHDSSQNLN